MVRAINDKIYTVEEYIQFEESSEIRHEFVNGQLYDMSGASDLHNEICQNITFLLRGLLAKTDFKIYMEGVKCKIQGEDYYTYPDVFITGNDIDKANKYIKQYPFLIVEVLSDNTRKYDTIDKFIQYQKIDTLEYYILVEPEFMYINCFSKDETGEWQSAIFNKSTDFIQLKKLAVELPVNAIYESA